LHKRKKGVKGGRGGRGEEGEGYERIKIPYKGQALFLYFFYPPPPPKLLTRYIVFLGLHCFSLLQFPMSLAIIT
jgi:hypothetical protein